jgi:CRP/FNR family transcriptional regulator, anaerobic regulatory protein
MPQARPTCHTLQSFDSSAVLQGGRGSSGLRATATPCTACTARGTCLASDLVGSDMEQFAGISRAKRKVARGAMVFQAGEGLEAVYVVRRGAFKTVRVSREGQEKVVGFYLPGEMLGLGSIGERKHHESAVALEESELCALPFLALQRMASTVAALQQGLVRAMSREIARDDALMLLMGSMSAEQRLAAFLLSLSRRNSRLGCSPERFVLRMRRVDVGSYLGVASETVSRLFSRLQRDGLIAVHQAEISVDLIGLRETLRARGRRSRAGGFRPVIPAAAAPAAFA